MKPARAILVLESASPYQVSVQNLDRFHSDPFQGKLLRRLPYLGGPKPVRIGVTSGNWTLRHAVDTVHLRTTELS